MQKFFVFFASLVIGVKGFAFKEEPKLFELDSVSTNKIGIKPITNFLYSSSKSFKAPEVSKLWREGLSQIGNSIGPDGVISKETREPICDNSTEQRTSDCETTVDKGKFICSKFVFNGTPFQFYAA